MAIPVDEDLFRRISIRERSYYLSDDLRDLFSEKLDKPLFTYYPKEENYQLYLQGKRKSRSFSLVITFITARRGFGRIDRKRNFYA